jgi:diacylglycerol kinase (ATP)
MNALDSSTHKNQPFLFRLRCAFAGIAHAVRAEHSFRFQILCLIGVIVTLGVLRPTPIWWAAVALACGGVVAAELMNTAVENLADLLHPEVHPALRIVKDCAAAAVLVTVVGALAVGAALGIELARGV